MVSELDSRSSGPDIALCSWATLDSHSASLYPCTQVYSCLALSRKKKIVRKPFGSQEIVLLWEINEEVTSPSLKYVRFS